MAWASPVLRNPGPGERADDAFRPSLPLTKLNEERVMITSYYQQVVSTASTRKLAFAMAASLVFSVFSIGPAKAAYCAAILDAPFGGSKCQNGTASTIIGPNSLVNFQAIKANYGNPAGMSNIFADPAVIVVLSITNPGTNTDPNNYILFGSGVSISGINWGGGS